MAMAENETKLHSLRITSECEIARRKELGDIYLALVDEARRIGEQAARVHALINDDFSLVRDKMPKSEAQRRKDAARALRSIAANLDDAA